MHTLTSFPFFTISLDKEKTTSAKPPVLAKGLLSPDSNVKNSFISNGAMIEGEVVNSVIGRGVKVSKGAKISNSVILTETFIDENICIDKSVVDKNAKIIHTKKVSGTFENPLYIKRGDII